MCLTLSKLNIMDTCKLYDMHAVTIDVASETGLHTRRLCKSCAVDFQKLKVQCRTLTCCFLVISVFLSSLIVANAIITLNIRERLLQIEIKNELLENKVESLEERLESLRFPKSDSLVTTNTGDITEIVTRNDDRKDEYQLLSRSKRQARHEGAKGKKNNKSGKGKRCKKDLGGYRNTRTASSDTPHFYLNGSGRGTQGGRFSWSHPRSRTFDGVNDHFGAETIANTGDVEKVTIKIPGMYFIFAKILANGRENRDSDVNPPMGISLMKRTAQGSEEMMDISWTTQDDRGRKYPIQSYQITGVSRSFPSDTMTVMGIYMLNVNDKIYVQRPGDNLYDDRERYVSGAQQAQFGAFLIERRTS